MTAHDPVERMVEALLFAAAEPLTLADIAERLPAGADAEGALVGLRARYAGRGVELAQVGERWRFNTAVDLAFLMTKERVEPRRLSRSAQETLAIVAYHQPITRAEIDAIRGVQSGAGALQILVEAGLVRMRGRRRTPGRPVTWATTDQFLVHYGLEALGDLPGAAEMKSAGLLGQEIPIDFAMPSPEAEREEDPIDPADLPRFNEDFLGTSGADGNGQSGAFDPTSGRGRQRLAPRG